MTVFEEAMAELEKHDPLKAGELKAKHIAEVAASELDKRTVAEKEAEERMARAVEGYLNPKNPVGGKAI